MSFSKVNILMVNMQRNRCSALITVNANSMRYYFIPTRKAIIRRDNFWKLSYNPLIPLLGRFQRK